MPLDEPSEAYAVALFASDGRILRSLTASAPSLLYPAADESTDFGAPQSVIEIAVAQLGTVAGPGPARRARVPVRAG